jgi:hypothetical protein
MGSILSISWQVDAPDLLDFLHMLEIPVLGAWQLANTRFAFLLLFCSYSFSGVELVTLKCFLHLI